MTEKFVCLELRGWFVLSWKIVFYFIIQCAEYCVSWCHGSFVFFIVELLNADFSSACLHSTFNSQQFNSYQKWQNRMVGVSYIVYHIPCVLCLARCFFDWWACVFRDCRHSKSGINERNSSNRSAFRGKETVEEGVWITCEVIIGKTKTENKEG